MQFRTTLYDVTLDPDGKILRLYSWVSVFLAHPASRSIYRKFANLFDDGHVVFSLPGLPTMHSVFVERSADIFGEDATLTKLTMDDTGVAKGALAMCLNGSMVQLLCLEPTADIDNNDAVSAVRTIADAIQQRDPSFYGRGSMTRQVIFDHVASTDDIKTVFPYVRLREDHYVFTQDDGISDFWE